MKITFKTVLNALLNWKKELRTAVVVPVNNAYRGGNVASEDKGNSDRCLRILNYWLDVELFDLPECPMDTKKHIVSEPADKFVATWGKDGAQKYLDGKLPIKEDSRLLVMFQCHRAGYIAKDDERHPNYLVPRTYLVAQAMIPRWDEESCTILWSRSEEDQDLIINLATIRTLYRRCRSSVPDHMSLSDWVEARVQYIETMLHTGLALEDEDSPLDTETLCQRIIALNRDLAEQFWPDKQAREYMLQQCQPIESSFQDDKLDAPRILKDGAITFRWRFCYYPDGCETQQLGPFFVQDLERAIASVGKLGAKALSRPLQAYLLGNNDQVEVGTAVNNGDFFLPLTEKLIHGRWPDDPKNGLSLLQTVAVNVVTTNDENPVVAVNGPPGTGKTTLLKDIVADRFVARTRLLKDLSRGKDWLTDERAVQAVMQHSIVVASSNNKAVENISKELPSIGKLAKAFADSTRHFRELAPKGDWGLFCAVLGNSTNRKAFKPALKRLAEHMDGIKDPFQLNYLVNSLRKKGRAGAAEVFGKFATSWKGSNKLLLLVADIKKCKAYTDHKIFFEPFVDALSKMSGNALSVEEFSSHWRDLDEVHWNLALAAIEAFKKQWFGKKLGQEYLHKKLIDAETAFDVAYAKIESLADDIPSDMQLDWREHLLHENSYLQQENESAEDAERRLQLSSPFGSEVVNRCRTEAFIKALALNEAILENAAANFSEYWDQLELLIDGRLQTKETNPEHQQLWSMLFLFFPVVSTALSSVENQFRLMQKPGGFGLVMLDEAGQAINYHAAGLLQRSSQAIFVGDPIQLQPVVTMPPSVDLAIAEDFFPLSKKDGEHCWGDDFLVSATSAQSIADNAGRYMAKIGQRKVGIPLLVHRRCTEPMFSVANKIAYDNRMVLARKPFDWCALQSGWIHVSEGTKDLKKFGYANSMEAVTALELVQYLVEVHPAMVGDGVYIITPFSVMRQELKRHWAQKAKSLSNHGWMLAAFGNGKKVADVKQFAEDNIGTVHTFQGKEASTVILCTSASKVRNKEGGITWVNQKPNLLNVAVTRAKHHLFVIGNKNDWSSGTRSSELQRGGMLCYDGLEQFKRQQAVPFDEHCFDDGTPPAAAAGICFNFG